MYEKILVAVDHSEVAARVLNAALELASLSQGEVWVLHLREREPMGKTGLLMSTESRDEVAHALPDNFMVIQQEHADLPAPPRCLIHALTRS